MEYTKNREIEILRWGGIAATVTAVLLMLAGCSGPSAVSYPARHTAGALTVGLGQVDRARQEGVETSRYLEEVHGQLHPLWAVERQRRATMLADKGGLTVDLEIALDEQGQAGWVKVTHASGSADLDAAAVEVVMAMRRLPALPVGVSRGHAFLRWRLSADGNRCGPGYASLLVVRASKAEELGRALDRHQYANAAVILRASPSHPALLAEVVRAGLADKSAERRARVLPMAYGSSLEAMCHQVRGSPLGHQALFELVRRREGAVVSRLLAAEVGLSARAKAKPAWTLALLGAARRLKLKPSAYTLDAILASPRAAEVFAAAPLCEDAAQMDAVLGFWDHRPAVAGPLWVRRCWLDPNPNCQAEVIKHLNGKGRQSTLRGLRRYPLPGVMAQVARLVRQEPEPKVRVEAMRALASYGKAAPLGSLFIALKAGGSPEVVATAARMIGELKRSPRRSSFRLAEVGYAVRRGPVAAAVLEAMAMLGEEIFREDVIRLQRRLAPENQARVVAALWGFGEAVRPQLSMLALEQDPRLSSAARLALSRLAGAKAPALAPPPAPAPQAPTLVRTLDDVISLALSKAAGPGPSASR